MKNTRIRFWVCGAVTGILGAGLSLSLIGQVPDPALTISRTGSNYFLLTITNGVSTANYEVYRWLTLNTKFTWGDQIDQIVGTQGQTNFVVPMGIEEMGFFTASPGLDWDLDGVENWLDGDPTNSSVGVLDITIDSPVHGTVFQ